MVQEGFCLVNFPCIYTWSPAIPPLVGWESSRTPGCPGDKLTARVGAGSSSSTTPAMCAVSLRQGTSLLVKAWCGHAAPEPEHVAAYSTPALPQACCTSRNVTLPREDERTRYTDSPLAEGSRETKPLSAHRNCFVSMVIVSFVLQIASRVLVQEPVPGADRFLYELMVLTTCWQTFEIQNANHSIRICQFRLDRRRIPSTSTNYINSIYV